MSYHGLGLDFDFLRTSFQQAADAAVADRLTEPTYSTSSSVRVSAPTVRADGESCSADTDCQSRACNTIEQKCYTPVFQNIGVQYESTIPTTSSPMIYAASHSGGLVDTGGGGGGGFPQDDEGDLPPGDESGCPTGAIVCKNAAGKVGCCCDAVNGYGPNNDFSGCVKVGAGGGAPAAGGGSMAMVAGAAALALLLFRK